MTGFVIVGASDDAAVVKGATDMLVVSTGAAQEHAVAARSLPLHDFLSRAVCAVALSEQGLAEVRAFVSKLHDTFGAVDIPFVDLIQPTSEGLPVDTLLLRQLVLLMDGRIDLLAQRNVAFMRDNSELRLEQDTIQRAFVSLERFVSEGLHAGRSLFVTLAPSVSKLRMEVASDEVLIQRLPRDSSGLSDVALYVASDQLDPDGSLVVSLITVENGSMLATWEIPGSDIHPGWLRLALPTSLGPDRYTARVSVQWYGEGSIGFECAMRHPDRRFQALLDDQPKELVLAMKLWTYLPGSDTAPSNDAHLPVGKRARRKMLSSEKLKAALCLNTEDQYFLYREEFAALQIHALAGTVATGVIRDSVRASTKAVRAHVETRSPEGPVIEYAIAVAPPSHRPSTPDTLPVFAPGARTEWIALAPMTGADLLLPLAEGRDNPLDLYLMTRLHSVEQNQSWAWSTFKRIEMIETAEELA